VTSSVAAPQTPAALPTPVSTAKSRGRSRVRGDRAKALESCKDKQLLSKIFESKITKKYRVTSHMTPLGITPKRVKSSLNLSSEMVYERANNKNSVSADTVLDIQDFYVRDDNSRIAAGKKQTLTRKKIKMQKRFLLDTLINLYEKFRFEYPYDKISNCMFAKLRPYFVVKPTAKDRDMCLCQTHENGQLLADRLCFFGSGHHKTAKCGRFGCISML